MAAFGSFLDLANEACVRSRRLETDATDLALAKSYVNEEYLRVLGGTERWRFLRAEGQFVVSTGSDLYQLDGIATAIGVTGGIEEVLQVINDSTGSNPLRRMSWTDMEFLADSTQDSDPQGEPVAWSPLENRIRLYPTPDSDYTLGVLARVKAVAMTADDDYPLIPEAFRRPILANLAAARLLIAEGGAEQAQLAASARAEASSAVEDLRMRYVSWRDEEFRVVSPGFQQDLTTLEDSWG